MYFKENLLFERKRPFGGGGGRGRGRGGRGGGGRDGGVRTYDPEQEHELLVWDNPPRPDREPEPNIFVDSKFNYWNLPVKARVLLVSNVPKVTLVEKKFSFITAPACSRNFFNTVLLAKNSVLLHFFRMFCVTPITEK